MASLYIVMSPRRAPSIQKRPARSMRGHTARAAGRPIAETAASRKRSGADSVAAETGVTAATKGRKSSMRRRTVAVASRPTAQTAGKSRKRSAADLVTGGTPVTAAMKGRKPSDYCKNERCQGAGGQRRRKTSGFQGYCSSCGPRFVPDAVAAAKAKRQQYMKTRAERFPCVVCGFIHYHKLDPETAQHYCKVCWRQRNSMEKCFYCLSRHGVSANACTWTDGCGRQVNVCAICVGLWQRPVCMHCWQQDFAGGCLLCKGPIGDILSTRGTHARTAHRLRFCATCHHVTFADPAEDARSCQCYYCHASSDTVATVQCLYLAECPGSVNVCSQCRQLREALPCSACYCRDWGETCYACNKNRARWSEYGKYCKACFHSQTESGRRQVLAEEAAAYYQRLATSAEPTGHEAALQNLILPIHDGPELAPYSEEPTYLSPVHCRICLADCSNVALAAGSDEPSVEEDLRGDGGAEREAAECPSTLPSRGSENAIRGRESFQDLCGADSDDAADDHCNPGDANPPVVPRRFQRGASTLQARLLGSLCVLAIFLRT